MLVQLFPLTSLSFIGSSWKDGVFNCVRHLFILFQGHNGQTGTSYFIFKLFIHCLISLNSIYINFYSVMWTIIYFQIALCPSCAEDGGNSSNLSTLYDMDDQQIKGWPPFSKSLIARKVAR